MAFLFASASSQYIIGGSAPVTGDPCTMACWYRPTASTGSNVVVSVGRSTGSARYQLFQAGGTITAQRIDNANATLSSALSTTISNGVWYHFAATFGASGDAITVWVNGVAGTPATNSGSAITFDRMLIGTRLSGGTPGAYANGDIAEVGVWNAALNADEIASLSKGFPCRFARPSSLQFYSRLIRNLMDIRGGIALTNTNGATVSDHPRIIYPC